MPRQPREDLKPIIYLPDVSGPQKRARDAVEDSSYSVHVHKKTGPAQQYHRVFSDFSAWKRFMRKEGEKLNYEVLDYLISHLPFADARPCDEQSVNGLIAHTLFVPGCRVSIMQEKIAEELGCSVETARKAIATLKKCEIIVNWGKGWYEFDARYVWKGVEAIRQAFIPIQIHREAFKSITDGKLTIELGGNDLTISEECDLLAPFTESEHLF